MNPIEYIQNKTLKIETGNSVARFLVCKKGHVKAQFIHKYSKCSRFFCESIKYIFIKSVIWIRLRENYYKETVIIYSNAT